MKYQTIKLRDKADPEQLKKELAPEETEEEKGISEDSGAQEEVAEKTQKGA